MSAASEQYGIEAELRDINQDVGHLLRQPPADLSMGSGRALHDEVILCGVLGGKDVGKSTLINALARQPVTKVHAEIGRGTDRPLAYVHREAEAAVRHRLRDLGDSSKAESRTLSKPAFGGARTGAQGRSSLHSPSSFDGFNGGEELEVFLHDATVIKNVVLIDLPDFDSEFPEHEAIVRQVAPHLDRILWLQTPRKIGDRAWVKMFHRVIKDPRNVQCVLNKVDELLLDAECFSRGADGRGAAGRETAERISPEAFWNDQCQWVTQMIHAAGCPLAGEAVFSVSAGFPEPVAFTRRIAESWDDPQWEKFSRDKPCVERIAQLVCSDLDRLRNFVLSPLQVNEIRAVKEANRKHEVRTCIRYLREHYDLDRTVDQLTQACHPEYQQQVFDDAFGLDYCASVAAGFQTQMSSDSDLADRVLAKRVERYPLLGLVYWPLGWLSRAVGRRVSGFIVAPAVTRVDDPFDDDVTPLRDRIELMRSRLLADFAVLIDRLAMGSRLPSASTLAEQMVRASRRLVPQLEQQTLDNLKPLRARSSILGKAALWFILLWFPLLQPMLAGLLPVFTDTGVISGAKALYVLVTALSATRLLASLAVVAAIYVAVLAMMHSGAIRWVRKYRLGTGSTADTDEGDPGVPSLIDAVGELLVQQVAIPLLNPLREKLTRLHEQQTRLRKIAGN